MNTDPREISSESGSRSRGFFWLGLLLVLIILVLWAGSQWFPLTLDLSQSNTLPATALPQRTFQVTGVPQVIVKDFAGQVTLQADAHQEVSVNALEHQGTTSKTGDVQYNVTQKDNTIEVYVTRSSSSSESNESVDVTVALPAMSDIQVVLGAGSINVSGVSGLMNLQTAAGNIVFAGGTIKGASSFQTDAGSITFAGTLTARGNYTFTTYAGLITLTLPANSSFTLDATTSVGRITNDFSSSSVGNHPTSQLHVHTSTGSIAIHKQ